MVIMNIVSVSSAAASLTFLKMYSIVRGVIPGNSGVPDIVCVFPDPVAPYAKIVALYPATAESTRSTTLSKTLFCDASGWNTLSNIYAFAGMRFDDPGLTLRGPSTFADAKESGETRWTVR